jgi:dTDP-4-amino-4,6-dideoxygalactose transaminase
VNVPFLDVGATWREARIDLDSAYQRVMARGWVILGEELEAFESEFARYCGSRYCIGVGNGLDALTLSLRALGIGPGDEVLVPAQTFIATWLAVAQAGARPVPVDVDPATCNLNHSLVEAAITERAKAIMPVHLFGQPAAMKEISEVARRRGLWIVEDAAQAHGARYRERRVGSLGDAAGWSFYPGKNLGAYGDGGAVTTDDEEVARRLRLLRNYGSTRKYHHEVQGVNSRLDELQAAFLRPRLRLLDDWNERRRVLAKRYLQALSAAPGLRLPNPLEEAEAVWHLFVVRHAHRDALKAALEARGVETLIHYPVTPGGSAAFAGVVKGTWPVAESWANEALSLPMGPHVTQEQADHVIAIVLEECRSLAGRETEGKS